MTSPRRYFARSEINALARRGLALSEGDDVAALSQRDRGLAIRTIGRGALRMLERQGLEIEPITPTEDIAEVHTWNPNDKSAAVELSNGDLTASLTSEVELDRFVRSTSGHANGKWHFELVLGDGSLWSGEVSGLGLATAGWDVGGAPNSDSVLLWGGSYALIDDESIGADAGTYDNTGDHVAVEVDCDARLIFFKVNGADWNGSALASPATGVGGWDISAISGELFVALGLWTDTVETVLATANFGSSAFSVAVSSGFTAWDGGAEDGP